MANLHYRKLTVLPLLKDKTIYITSGQKDLFGLQENKSGMKYEALDLNQTSDTDWVEKNIKKASSLDIVIESDLCRFVILPALNNYPEPDVLSFLIQQRLKQKYIDFDASQFVIVHDQLKFNCPCLVVAFPKQKYLEFMHLKANFKITSFLPSIIAIWNCYEKYITGNLFLIIENKLAFLIYHDQGIIKEIDTFPVYLMGSLNFDYYLDLNGFKFSELEQTTSNRKVSLLSKKISDLLIENQLDKSQALNLIRVLS
jgi:hypothetical protein